VLGWYTILALIVTWPIATHFNSGLVGEVGGVDAYQNAWNMWWVAEALRHGHQPFWTPLLFYPEGVNLFWQTLGFSQGLVVLPVTLTLGPLAAVNATILCSFILGGLATFLLAYHLTRSAPAALVAGTVFAFSPYHFEKVIDGNIEVAALQWVPCYVLALTLLLERPGWRHALLAGAMLLWVSLGSWYYGLFCVLFTGCAALVWALGRERRAALRLFGWGILPLGIWVGVLAFPLISLAQGGDETLRDMRQIQAAHSADLLDFFLPNPVSPWWGSAVRAARSEVYPNAVIWNVALGWVGLLLGALGGIVAWRTNWRWMALLFATLILAMGPELRIGGWASGVPLPFMLIRDLPGIRASQRPNHMVVLSSVMLAILAAYGVAWLLRERRWVAWAAALSLSLAAIAVDGYAGPLRIVSRTTHPFYASLPPPDGAIMPLPMYLNINRSDNLTPQMTHGWPILGGYVARPPEYPFGKYMPGVRELQDGSVANDIVSPGWPDNARASLAASHIRYVTLDLTSNKDSYFRSVRALLSELQVGAPLVADAALEAYALPRDWSVQPFAFLGAGWQKLEQQPSSSLRWRWMGAQGEIRLYNPYTAPVVATVQITAASYTHERSVQMQFDGLLLDRLFTPSDTPSTRQFHLLLAPGEHVLTLAAEASNVPERPNQPISVRLFAVRVAFTEPLPALATP
jgi:hypothetical protein